MARENGQSFGHASDGVLGERPDPIVWVLGQRWDRCIRLRVGVGVAVLVFRVQVDMHRLTSTHETRDMTWSLESGFWVPSVEDGHRSGKSQSRFRPTICTCTCCVQSITDSSRDGVPVRRGLFDFLHLASLGGFCRRVHKIYSIVQPVEACGEEEEQLP